MPAAVVSNQPAPKRRPSGDNLRPFQPPLNQDMYTNKPLPGTPRPGLQPSTSKAYLLNRVPGASQVYLPPTRPLNVRPKDTSRERSKPPTCQPFGQHTVLARAASQPLLHTYQSPNSVPRRTPITNAQIAALTVTASQRSKVNLTPEPVTKPIIGEGERTLFGESRASPTSNSSSSSSSRSRRIPPPRDVKVDFTGLWERWVNRSLHTEEDLQTLIEEKTSHPLGKVAAEFSPFHAIPVLSNPTMHNFSVQFNPDPIHLARWRRKTQLMDVKPNEEFMEELFWKVVSTLENQYGWLRHVHDDITKMDPTARHYVLRPGIHYSSLPQPNHPLRNRIDMLYLPKGPQVFLSRKGDFWATSISQQFSHLRAHRHSTLGLVFNQWMNTEDDAIANADALPPPIWFLLYAMQAAYPGLFVIREETENEQVLQTIERGLPPYEVLADRACGPFLMGLLGESGYTDVLEASIDARTSTIVEVLIKGSVRPRKRSNSNNSGLPPLPNDGKAGFRRLLRRPSWLSRWQTS